MRKNEKIFNEKFLDLNLTFYSLSVKASAIKSGYAFEKSVESLVKFINQQNTNYQSA